MRSETSSSSNWMRFGPPQMGLERMDAFLTTQCYERHRHDTYVVGYTVDGAHSFFYRGQQVYGGSGNVSVLYPDEPHDGQALTRAGFRYRVLYIEPRLVREALGERARSLPFVRTPMLDLPSLLPTLVDAFSDLDGDLEGLRVEEIILSISETLLALDNSLTRKPISTTCRARVERAREFLDHNFERVVTSDQIENVTGLDRYTLARQFKTQLGTSPYRYLMMRRLKRARVMLRSNPCLADVALACGFADQSHMTRQFKRAVGLTPGAWRVLCSRS